MIDPCLHGVPVGEPPRRLEDDGGVGSVLGVGVLGERLPLVELPGAAEPVLLPEFDLLLDAHGRGVARAVVVAVLGHRQLVSTLRGGIFIMREPKFFNIRKEDPTKYSS